MTRFELILVVDIGSLGDTAEYLDGARQMPIQSWGGVAAMEHKIREKWHQRAIEIFERFLKLAQAKGSLTSDSEVLNFLALAICGEAGELANLVKKNWRGDEVDRDQIRDEIADIRIYLERISRHLDFDLDKACERKLEEVHERLLVKERHEEAGVATPTSL